MNDKEKAWQEFFGTGWEYGKTPSKLECFNAGYDAAIKFIEAKVSDKPKSVSDDWIELPTNTHKVKKK